MNRLKKSKEFANYMSNVLSKNSRPGVLYIVLFPYIQKFKIGFSTNLDNRFINLKWRYQEPEAKILSTKKGSKHDEYELHKKIKKYQWVSSDTYKHNPRELYSIDINLTNLLSDYFDCDVFGRHIYEIFSMDTEELLNNINQKNNYEYGVENE